MAERVRIVLELTMDDERWVQDALAIRMSTHLAAEAEEHGVDLTTSYVSVTSAGGSTSRASVAELVPPVYEHDWHHPTPSSGLVCRKCELAHKFWTGTPCPKRGTDG